MSNLIKCIECGRDVSKAVSSCPHCRNSNLQGVTCGICQVSGVKESETIKPGYTHFHKSCYDRANASFREVPPLVHTCEACSRQYLFHFQKNLQQYWANFSRGFKYGGLFDLSGYYGREEKGRFYFSCENCGHPNCFVMDIHVNSYPYAGCYICYGILNKKDHPKIAYSKFGRLSDNAPITTEYYHVHNLCYQHPINKAHIEENSRNQSENALQSQTEAKKKEREAKREARKRELLHGYNTLGEAFLPTLGATLFFFLPGYFLTITGVGILGVPLLLIGAYPAVRFIYALFL